MYRQMHSLLADNWHIGRYMVQLADIVQSADYRMSADYWQYRICRISVSAEFPNLDIICTLKYDAVKDEVYKAGDEQIQSLTCASSPS